jgi:hypothetical protein
MYVSTIAPEYLDVAATIIANITAASGVAQPVQIHFDRPGNSPGAGFVVAPLDELTGAIGARVRALIADAGTPVIAQPRKRPADGSALAASPGVPHAWNDRAIENEQFLARSFDQAKASIIDWLGSRGFDFHRSVVAAPAPGLSADGIVIAQMLRQSGDWHDSLSRLVRVGANLDLWTVITTTSAGGLSEDLNRLIASRLWQGLSGEAATYHSSNDTIVARKPDAVVYVATQPLSWQNARLMLGGMLSSNLFAYVGLIIVGCLLLGAVTQLVLRQVGRGTDDAA